MTKKDNMKHCEHLCALRVIHYGRHVGCAHEQYCRTFHKNDPVCNVSEKEETMDKKVCTECGRLLPLENFAKSKCTKDGHEGQCKECRCKRAKENRAAKRVNDAQEKSAKSAKSARMQKAVKAPKPTYEKLLESIPVTGVDCRGPYAHLAGLVNWTDADLVTELRNRGYEVTAKKEVRTIVEL